MAKLWAVRGMSYDAGTLASHTDRSSMPYILACIDGTGSTGWRRADGLNSHVYRFYQDAAVEPDFKLYRDGPGTLGFEMGRIVEEVSTWVQAALAARTMTGLRAADVQICLIGHSRGAVGAAAVVNRLAAPRMASACAVPIRVKFLGLYDAVDRSFLNLDTTLRNVDIVAHAVRADRTFGGSRWSFDTVDFSRPLQRQEFRTSHGGIGGDPGLFNSLDAFAGDGYCNALRVVMTDDELRRRYGTVHMPRGAGPPLTNIPRYRRLTGEAYNRRVEELRERLEDSWAADKFLRRWAGEACGAGLLVRTSPQIPYDEVDAVYAQRLAVALGWPTLQWP
jgi:hypothetical protein